VRLRVSNPLADLAPVAPGARLGLVGVSERVSLVGGSVTYGVRDETGFVLEAVLPMKEQP
jgi:signal transduction histidine kinase